MGNCLRHESSMQWAGDDWGAAVSDQRTEKAMKMEEEGLLGGGKIGFITSSSAGSSSSSTTATEIKIKITKKQLEELLGKADVKELSVQQVLAHLMINVSTTTTDRNHHETHQRPWRPALQSIPELN